VSLAKVSGNSPVKLLEESSLCIIDKNKQEQIMNLIHGNQTRFQILALAKEILTTSSCQRILT